MKHGDRYRCRKLVFWGGIFFGGDVGESLKMIYLYEGTTSSRM